MSNTHTHTHTHTHARRMLLDTAWQTQAHTEPVGSKTYSSLAISFWKWSVSRFLCALSALIFCSSFTSRSTFFCNLASLARNSSLTTEASSATYAHISTETAWYEKGHLYDCKDPCHNCQGSHCLGFIVVSGILDQLGNVPFSVLGNLWVYIKGMRLCPLVHSHTPNGHSFMPLPKASTMSHICQLHYLCHHQYIDNTSTHVFFSSWCNLSHEDLSLANFY